MYDSMRNHSAMLAMAYRRLKEEREGPEGKTEVPLIAATFNGAFSVEVALKALIVRDQNFRSPEELLKFLSKHHRHDLAVLFNLLSPAKQRFIRYRLSKVQVYDENFLVMGGALVDAPEIEQLVMPRSFDDHMSLVGRAFEQWRYSYEQPSLVISMTFLDHLVEVTQEALGRIL